MHQAHSTLAVTYPTHVAIRENTQGLAHWFRAHLYGECPECHGTHSKRVYGWAKQQCDECGHTWNYGL